MVKDEENTDVDNTFFASVSSCLLDTWPSELEDRNGEQNEASIIHRDGQ